MFECEICGRNEYDIHYEKHNLCQECHNEYLYCEYCGEHVVQDDGLTDCSGIILCEECMEENDCEKYINDILCTKCSMCRKCCDIVCGKIKRDNEKKLQNT